jgi:hypothetical protein
MKPGLSCLAVFVVTASLVHSQEIEVPPGTPLDWLVVSAEAKAPFPKEITAASLKTRLKAGGTTSLSGGDLILGPPSFSDNATLFMALDTLELRNGARIVTNGNSLILFVNKLISEDGKVIAFKENERRAANGQSPGDFGQPGVPGRLVSIHVIHDLSGILHVDLSGQGGGNGAKGATGPTGARGQKGSKAVKSDIPPECKSGGGNGLPGYPGGKGGKGGAAGNGGAGGILELYNIGTKPIPAERYTFVASAGSPGAYGAGGQGGDGGEGGDGGDGDGLCNGGSPGSKGPSGPSGDNGDPGQKPEDGKAIVKNITLQALLKEQD